MPAEPRRTSGLVHYSSLTLPKPLTECFEVVLGDGSMGSGPADGDQAGKRWQACGVPDSVVSDALAYIRETGGVLNEASLHPGDLHLLRDLHDETWFQLEGGYLIETELGSWQGCKFEATSSA